MKKADRIAQILSECAYQALLEEVYTTPKPGLVDRISNGAHVDMDLSLFEKSAKTIKPYFYEMAQQGCIRDTSPEVLFCHLRAIGKEAENAMFRATKGVNTHKGAIFTLGILCGAMAKVIYENESLVISKLQMQIEVMTKRILLEELQRIHKQVITKDSTHGEINLKKYDMGGIRQEVIDGYPSIFNLALPVLKDGLERGYDWECIKLQTLCQLMAKVNDSNIVYRHNLEILKQVQKEMTEFCLQGGAYQSASYDILKEMDKKYSCLNISPGGSADLLAAAIFIEFSERKMNNDYHTWYAI